MENEENHSVEQVLIVKHFTGEVTAAEEKELQTWRLVSKENEKTFQQIRKTFELTGSHYSPSAYSQLDVDVTKEWDQFSRNIEEKEKIISFIPKQSSSNNWLRVAAVVLLVVGAGFVINYLITQSKDLVYQTAQNTESITLPDGSTVFLNRNSMLSFSKKFSEDDRNVSLAGEAFFDVVPDAKHPFKINVDQAEITVLGTSFNVQTYKNREEVEVTVETGLVKLNPLLIDKAVELRAGEKGIFKKKEKTLVSALNDDTNYLAWKTRRIVFEASDLDAVAKAISTAYGMEVLILPNVSSACRVTVTFENQSLDAVLKVLASTLDLTYKIEGNKIEITKAGC